MPLLDTTRYDRLSEGDVLKRIGALLATAIARCGLIQSTVGQARPRTTTKTSPSFDPTCLLNDPVEQQVVRYLVQVGPASPRELSAALGRARRTVTRKLARLRATGLCESVGKTRNTRYQLRKDFGRN